MKKKNRLLIAFALGSLLTTGYAFACPGGADGYCPVEPPVAGRPGPGSNGPGMGMGHMGYGAPIMHLVKRLDLTPEQDAKIRTILKGDAPRFKRDVNEKRAHRAAIHDLFEAKTFNESQARSIVKDETAQMMDMRIGMLKTEYKIYQVLTLDQRAQMDKMLSDGPRVAQPISNDVPPPPPRP